MSKTIFVMLDTETNKTETWTMADMLSHINDDRNPEWVDYDENDWHNGWKHFCEEGTFKIVSIIK